MEDVKNVNTKRMNYKSLLIENIKYRTLLTEKYKQRKPFARKDEKVLTAFIPGTVKVIFIKEKARVKTGDKLLVLEAMKMENDIVAPADCVIKKIHVTNGEKVRKEQILIEFE